MYFYKTMLILQTVIRLDVKMDFMKDFILVIAMVFGYVASTFGDESKKTNFIGTVEEHGYPVEVHEIETDDGYLLDVYRVPYGRQSSIKKPNNLPIILNHGLMGCAENFLIGGSTKALTYILADNGFDVWLCNARGTWHSRKHKTLNPDRNMKQFWKFTWHEIGYYDLPATIDYVLNTTDKQKLHYIGHSQGTTTFFAMMSERPEYNDKIHIMVAMAPSALLGHIKEPALRLIAPTHEYLKTIAESLNIYELIPQYLLSNEAIRLIGKTFCHENAPIRALCSNILIVLAGYTPEQLDPATIPFIASIGPAGASVYQALHYAQLVTTGKFIKYDWGPKENLKRYNSTTPSEYKLENMRCPVSFLYGEADILVTKEDVEILAARIPNLVDLYKIPYKSWSHMDFIWGKDVNKYMNKHVLRILRKFT